MHGVLSRRGRRREEIEDLVQDASVRLLGYCQHGGTPLTRPVVYHQNSAVSAEAEIQTPTMFVVGGQYSINSPAMAWLYSALLTRGVDTLLVRYPDEGHVVDKRENQLDLLARIWDWIVRHDIPPRASN